MFRQYLRAKIHSGVVTKTEADCDGSIGIDLDLLDRADIGVYEKVLVADCDNGNRFETYAVAAKRGSGEINILGATAQLSAVGHRVNILAFGFADNHFETITPRIIKPYGSSSPAAINLIAPTTSTRNRTSIGGIKSFHVERINIVPTYRWR